MLKSVFFFAIFRYCMMLESWWCDRNRIRFWQQIEVVDMVQDCHSVTCGDIFREFSSLNRSKKLIKKKSCEEVCVFFTIWHRLSFNRRSLLQYTHWFHWRIAWHPLEMQLCRVVGVGAYRMPMQWHVWWWKHTIGFPGFPGLPGVVSVGYLSPTLRQMESNQRIAAFRAKTFPLEPRHVCLQVASTLWKRCSMCFLLVFNVCKPCWEL